ncbi:MAG: nicotinate (nicotinamide) nucleotide adenylyltransferase [Eubacteriales bacterium]|nr:nicotinate (nicotinamide) nucleotide adenylyltransferase [Eubacteriales bacterium]
MRLSPVDRATENKTAVILRNLYKKTGIFGGTFDPVHIGHIRAAKAFLSEAGLDRLYLLPNFIPPLKDNKGAPAKDRLEMLKIAFNGTEKALVDDFELKNGGTSYTYKTIGHYKELFPDDEIFLLIGDDNLRIFEKWVRFEYILENSVIYVALRSGENTVCDTKRAAVGIMQKYKADIRLLYYTPTVISSSELRKAICENTLSPDYLVPGVYEYIRKKGLYR